MTQRTHKHVYTFMALMGTVIPWLFFARFFQIEGLNIALFLSSLFHNGAAGGFSADVIISIAVFCFWSYFDACEHQIAKWWYVIPAGCCVGLSLALPMYLYLRTKSPN